MAEERHPHDIATPWWGEHLFRYEWAGTWVRAPTIVLDVACGSGYGTTRLSTRTGARVVGGDVDAASLSEALAGRTSETAPRFVVMDGSRLPLADGSVDLVVSFETLEHTRRYREMLAEFARVLTTEGILLLSTPNRPVNSPGGRVENPFHTQEFDRRELKELLTDRFDQVEVLGQRYARYDALRGVRRGLGRATEWLQYRRGVRKLPLPVRDALMRMVAGRPQYPLPSEFRVVSDPQAVDRCRTLLARAAAPRRT